MQRQKLGNCKFNVGLHPRPLSAIAFREKNCTFRTLYSKLEPVPLPFITLIPAFTVRAFELVRTIVFDVDRTPLLDGATLLALDREWFAPRLAVTVSPNVLIAFQEFHPTD